MTMTAASLLVISAFVVEALTTVLDLVVLYFLWLWLLTPAGVPMLGWGPLLGINLMLRWRNAASLFGIYHRLAPPPQNKTAADIAGQQIFLVGASASNALLFLCVGYVTAAVIY